MRAKIVEAEGDVAMEEYCLIVSFGFFNLLFYRTQDQQPRTSNPGQAIQDQQPPTVTWSSNSNHNLFVKPPSSKNNINTHIHSNSKL